MKELAPQLKKVKILRGRKGQIAKSEKMKINIFNIVDNLIKNTQGKNSPENVNDASKTHFEMKTPVYSNQKTSNTTVLTETTAIKLTVVNNTDSSKLLKNLFNIPDDIQQLLNELVNKKGANIPPEELLKQPNLKIDTDLIKQMLEGNSKEALNKLLKLTQQTAQEKQSTDQLKDILSLLNALTPKKNATSQEVLTNLILLYLPWIPLHEKQKLEINFEKREGNDGEEGEENEKKSEQTALVIYIQTLNLGRFKISILISQNFSIKIEIENTDIKENTEQNKKYLDRIIEEINDNSRKDKINAKTELVVYEETHEKEELKQENVKREVVISHAKEVSPVLIITAQKISRIVIETDEKISLLLNREKMLPEN